MAKKPKVEQAPKLRKRPTSRAVRPTTEAPMSWRLEHVDLNGRWGWQTLARGSVSRLHKQLVGLEKDTRKKLEVEKKLVRIPCYDLCREAQERLRRLGLEEWEFLWQLALRPENRDKWRAWGLAEDQHFYLLWWDPKHTVCPRGPKKGIPKHH
jgi:hypothetical protein